MKSLLRQDPDIIMIGEIRDSETAELAIKAALTGHLVFSSIHAKDSIQCIDRLCNLGYNRNWILCRDGRTETKPQLVSLQENALEKVKLGIISLEEMIGVI